MTHEEMIAVLKAHIEGKSIQYRIKEKGNCWHYTPRPSFDFHDFEYRIAPERIVLYCKINPGGYTAKSSHTPFTGANLLLVFEEEKIIQASAL